MRKSSGPGDPGFIDLPPSGWRDAVRDVAREAAAPALAGVVCLALAGIAVRPLAAFFVRMALGLWALGLAVGAVVVGLERRRERAARR